MHGGAISGNTVNGKWAYGGGVWAAEGSTFIMTGGAVSGNTTKGNGHASGGGVRVEDGVTFTMSGGEISGNKVIGTSGGGSGGVDVTNALFTMKGGTISGNSVTAPYSSGGGVSVCGNDDGSGRATFIMEGGAIFGNVTASPINRAMSGGVDVRYSNFTMKGGRIQGNTDSDGFAKNTGSHENTAALFVWDTTAKWGAGGVYTKGGIPQTSGGDIVPIEADSSGRTNDTLIAVSGK